MIWASHGEPFPVPENWPELSGAALGAPDCPQVAPAAFPDSRNTSPPRRRPWSTATTIMASKDNGLRVCPTRTDASLVLFAHKVAGSRCQERQRKGYHKCFTCAYNNNYVQKHGLPQPKPEVLIVEPEESTVEVG